MTAPAWSQPALDYFAEHAIDPQVAEWVGVTEQGGALVFPYCGGRRRSLADGGPAKVVGVAGVPLAPWWLTGKPTPGAPVLVCEGESDALAALSALRRLDGRTGEILAPLAVAAIPGTGMPACRLAEELKAAGVGLVYLAFDGDDAGRKATGRIARALREVGLDHRVVGMPEGHDLAEVLAATGEAKRGRALAGLLDVQAPSAQPRNGGERVPESRDWPPLAPLTVNEAPAFPADALPDALACWVRATAEATQTPVALAAAMALAAASTGALGAAVVECMPGWEEELALYLAVVLPSGERKSAVVRAASAPLRALERELAEEARPRVAQAQASREALEERQKQLVRQLGKGDGDTRELAEVKERLAALPDPVQPRLLADDATPEALAGLLACHGRLGVLAAESALLDNLAGRYAEGKANLHLVCQAYSGEEARIDRRGRGPEHLPRPLLALGLAVQPHVLAVLAETAVMREQGFLPRLAVLAPPSKVGCRELHPPSVPTAVTGAYEDAIRTLATLNRAATTATTPGAGGSGGSGGTGAGLRLTLDAEAGAVLTELRADLEPRLDAHHGDLAAIGAWASKHPGRVARIAGLIHLLDAEERALPISGATMRAAVRIGDCLLAHACAALLEPGRDRLERAARWAVQHAGGFSLRDLYRGPCRAHGPVEDAEQLATLLEEHGYIRPLPTPAPSPAGGRPPSPRYEVNPGLLDALEPTGANARPATAPAATNGKPADDARAVHWLLAAVRRRALTDGEAAWRLDLLERLGPAAAMPAAWRDEA